MFMPWKLLFIRSRSRCVPKIKQFFQKVIFPTSTVSFFQGTDLLKKNVFYEFFNAIFFLCKISIIFLDFKMQNTTFQIPFFETKTMLYYNNNEIPGKK